MDDETTKKYINKLSSYYYHTYESLNNKWLFWFIANEIYRTDLDRKLWEI